MFKANNNKVVSSSKDRANKIIINLFNKSKNKKFGKLTCMPNIRAIWKLIFLIFNAKKFFII